MEEVETPSLDAPVEEKEGLCLTAGSCEACAEGDELVELPIDTTHGREGGKGGGGGDIPPLIWPKTKNGLKCPLTGENKMLGDIGPLIGIA